MIWWRELSDDEIHAAAQTVQSWGYLRQIEELEKRGIWARLGAEPHAYVWFVRVVDAIWTPHLCVSPTSRRRLGLLARHALSGMFHIAAFLGAEMLVLEAKPTSELAGYLERLGWRRDETWNAWVKDLADG